MTFEFVIVYQQEEGTPIHDVLVDRLGQVLMDNLNEFDFDAVDAMVRVNYERKAEDDKPVVLGFTLELPDETASARIVIDEFADELRTIPVMHVVKFEDPLLHDELAKRSEELYSLELKLRRVLTAIYLHAYREKPYELLREEAVKPQTKNPPTVKDMVEPSENEFFHLNFRQYGELNQRPSVKDVNAMLDLIKEHDTYAALCIELARQPVEHANDASFLASLKDSMPAIETMRNCVAHFRRPPQNLTNRYLSDLPSAHTALDYFLERCRTDWLDSLDTGELPEDEAAREAVEWALENAEWDDKAKTITLYDPDDDRIRSTVSTREELERYLRAEAENAYYANARGDSSDVAGTCHGDDYVQEVLEPLEDRLEKFFAEEENPDESKG